MKSKVSFLDLPKLPVSVEQVLLATCESIPLKEQDRQWVNDFHKDQLPNAAHAYGRQTAPIDQDVQCFIKDYYKNYFEEDLIMFVGLLKNVIGVPSISPPHCDRARHMSINYILSAGGNNVLTCFYTNTREIWDLSSAENKYYKDCTLDYKVKFPEKVWHAYNVQNYHSVENIEQSRCIFSILLAGNPTYEQFQNSHKGLIFDSSDKILDNYKY